MTGASLTSATATHLELLGRDAERAALAAAFDAARRARSTALVLGGEPGIGKSALLAHALGEAASFRTLVARGVEVEAELPFAGLHQLLRPVTPLIERLPLPQADALRSALGLAPGSTDNRFLVAAATLSLLGEAAEAGPLLCVVDDAHWLDRPSQDALLFAARRLEAEGIVMLLAARLGEEHRFDARGLQELRLAGLPAAAAGQLLERRAGAPVAPDVCGRLVAATGGNTLALTELAGQLTHGQLGGREPLPFPLPLAGGVEQALVNRVRALPPEAQRALLVAAAEESGDLSLALAAASRLGCAAAALDAAEQADLIRVGDHRIEFRHPLVRSAAYRAASFAERAAAHRALAASLPSDADADRRAWHLAAATGQPEEDVAAELAAAGTRAAQRSAYAVASSAFERAATLTPDEVPRAARLAEAGRYAWVAGQRARAATLLDGARPLALEPALRGDIDHVRGMIELGGGSPLTAYEILVSAARDTAPADPRRALEMLTLAGEAASAANDHERSIALGRMAAELQHVADDPARFLTTLLVGFGRLFGGDVAAGQRQLVEAIALARALADADLLLAAGRAAFYVGDDQAAYEFHARVVAQARAKGAIADIPIAGTRLALAEILAGRWSAGAATAAETVRLAQASDQEELAALTLVWLGLVAALRGDEAECGALCDEATTVAASRRLVEDAARWVAGVLELGAGRAPRALAHLRPIAHPVVVGFAALDRIEAAVRADQPAAAHDWLAPFERWAVQADVPWALARAAHGRALLAQGDEADAHFAAALERHAAAARPFERARTELAYGAFLRRARRRAAARGQLRAALDTFETLGAAPWAEQARAELRATGETARKRAPSDLEQLTPQELQVARFVAQGLTTREVAAQLFLSARTVDFHLRNIFAKLGISSRTQLAHLALDRASAPGDPASRLAQGRHLEGRHPEGHQDRARPVPDAPRHRGPVPPR